MLILNGQEIKNTDFVENFNEHGMEFVQYRGGKPRKSNPNLVVLHWTGGEGPASQVFRTLQQRQLGVDFCVDRLGNVYQFSDPGRVATSHCGSQNHRSIGIEIVNYGFRWPSWSRFNLSKIPRGAHDRIVYETIIHGQKVFIADFYARQRLATYRLVKQLCDEFEIPVETPDIYGILSSQLRNEFRGIVGHYHLSRRKLDPGTRLVDDVILACRNKNYLDQI